MDRRDDLLQYERRYMVSIYLSMFTGSESSVQVHFVLVYDDKAVS
jgi:hypothetical protein